MTELQARLDLLHALTERFSARAAEELTERFVSWPVDLSHNEIREVVGALLARQLTLAREISGNPGMWNGHIAPILLRAMADVHITLAWILRDPSERSKRFIYHGLGQEKLQVEHRRASLATREPLPDEEVQLTAVEQWINSQRLTFLTDVNVGSWSGLSTRVMAEEADCLDFYNYVYAPFSSSAHSMWNFIARYNLKRCRNPLHRLHSVPAAGSMDFDLHYLYLAGKYLQKSYAAFDETFSVRVDSESAFRLLSDGLDGLSEAPAETPEAVG